MEIASDVEKTCALKDGGWLVFNIVTVKNRHTREFISARDT